MEMAKLSFEGDSPFEGLEISRVSSTYQEFVDEYPVVAAGLANCALEHCLPIIGAMLTLPEFQSNAYRLEVLAHLACLCAKGKGRPTQAQLVAWFNQLDNGTCGRMEDPAEDVFVSVVSMGGEGFRIFEGNAEGNSCHTQVFLDILGEMPNRGSYGALKGAVESLLRISDEVVGRSGVPVFDVGNVTPVSSIAKPPDSVWSQLRKRAVLSDRELDQHGIDLRLLGPFTVQGADLEGVASSGPGNSPLDAKPLYRLREGICLFQPGLVGTAIRHLIITSCNSAQMNDELHAALGRAYVAHFGQETLFGLNAPRFEIKKFDSYFAGQVLSEIDPGRYLHLVLFVDGFEGFDDGWFIGRNPVSKISAFVEKAVQQAHDVCSANSGFKEGLTVVIGCGWGRALGLRQKEDAPAWQTEIIPAHDAITLSRTASFKALDFFRVLDASGGTHAQNISISNANGFLNLFAWIDSNNGHIVPHEKMGDNLDLESGAGFFSIPINCNLRLRQAAYQSVDTRVIRRSDGTIAKLRRAHSTPRFGQAELSPFYVDVEALNEKVFRYVYIGLQGIYWAEAHTATSLDLETRYQLGNMTMHWAEQVFRYVDGQNGAVAGSVIECAFQYLDDLMPDGSESVPTEEEIGNLVDFPDGKGTISVRKGFLSASRRPDNLGERMIVRALLRACSTALDLEEISDAAIVRNDRARHFHAFSVPQLRDFIRGDIPHRPMIIERMDDANTRLGLGWLCRMRGEGSRIDGLDDCKAYLRSLVGALIEKFKDDLSRFNRKALIEKLLRNHEALFAEMDTWKRTYGAIEALSSDDVLAASDTVKRISNFNAASMASRVVVEAAICESPISGGFEPGDYDIGRMLAHASLIHHMGGYSEAMVAGMMPPEIKISPAGEVMMNHDFTSEIVQPFGEFFQTRSLREASKKYADNFVSSPEGDDKVSNARPASVEDESFENAWVEEYGFSLDELKLFVGAIDTMLGDRRKAVLHWKRSEFVRFVKATSDLPEHTVERCLKVFTLVPREKWDASPDGFLSSAWFPWQFRRQLSLISRPFIQLEAGDESELLITPAMAIMHVAKFVSDARTGALDQKTFRRDGKLFKWIGTVNGIEGEAFNDRVAEHFRTAGWEAESNLTDGKILNRKKNSAFGDVDVLAWSKVHGRVLVVECKDLSFDKTLGEIARRLSNYQGGTKSGGKRDDLRKHLDRCEDIEANLAALSDFVAFEVKGIERVLLFSEATPIQFSKIADKFAVKVCTSGDINSDFSIGI